MPSLVWFWAFYIEILGHPKRIENANVEKNRDISFIENRTVFDSDQMHDRVRQYRGPRSVFVASFTFCASSCRYIKSLRAKLWSFLWGQCWLWKIRKSGTAKALRHRELGFCACTRRNFWKIIGLFECPLCVQNSAKPPFLNAPFFAPMDSPYMLYVFIKWHLFCVPTISIISTQWTVQMYS